MQYSPSSFLMYKLGTGEIAVYIQAQLLYKKCQLLAVTSIHLNAEANIEGHREGGLNAQAMN